MKKYISMIVTSLLLCACTSTSMSIDDARKAVLDDAGVKENGVTFSKEETHNDEYLFEFSDDNKKYSYSIKEDGSILSRDYTLIADDTDPQNNGDVNTSNHNKSNSDNNTDTNQANSISEQEAIEIALKAYNLDKNQVNDIDVDDEDENGRVIYRVEFHKDNQEYEVDINKQTGEIINKRVDKDERKVV